MSDLELKKGRGPLPVHSFLMDTFDIGMFATNQALAGLQANFTSWLAGLSDPIRFVCWQLPVSLKPKVEEVSVIARQAKEVGEMERHVLGQGYRRHFEELERTGNYQTATCGLAMWSKENPLALAAGIRGAFDVNAVQGEWPRLFSGQYAPRETIGFWYCAPVGRGGMNRHYWAVLVSYDFMPSLWTFWKPLAPLLMQNFPIALAIDVAESLERNAAIDQIETKITEYQAHLATLRGEDSRSVQRIEDCRMTLREIGEGDTLHRVSVVIAIAAQNVKELRNRVETVINETKGWFRLRKETGELMSHSLRFFAPQATRKIKTPATSWPVTSRELSLMFAPLGFPKLSSLRGVLRGDSVTGAYPFFYDSWHDKRGNTDKRATHEIWVGMTGFGKTFYCNCYLSREYTNGIPFDLLEPMGHGIHVATAFNLPWMVISSRHTKLNPLDVMMPTLSNQISHVIRIVETALSRPLSGDRQANIERGLLGTALERLYRPYDDLESVLPEDAPIMDDLVSILFDLGNDTRQTKPQIMQIAHDLADEIAALCCGNGTFATFLNGRTTYDLSFRGNNKPRVFSFHEIENDRILVGIAYTQVLSAIRRDSLADERPRIIAVDEVYRLMRHPSLLDFLIEAYKTFRTRRKKMISIDQNMSVFLESKARYIFENSPIRVIFNQNQGLHVFQQDAAFQHFNAHHIEIISRLRRFRYVMDIQDEGIFYLQNVPSEAEKQRFKTT